MKRAIQPFAFSMEGVDGIIVVNDVDWYPDDHAWVKAKPDLFVDADKHPDVVVAQPIAAAPKSKKASSDE